MNSDSVFIQLNQSEYLSSKGFGTLPFFSHQGGISAKASTFSRQGGISATASTFQFSNFPSFQPKNH